MKIQDSSSNSLKVTVGTKSVTHPRTHALTDAPKAICPINFFKVGGIKSMQRSGTVAIRIQIQPSKPKQEIITCVILQIIKIQSEHIAN